MRIIILGPPGAGKGTQAERLAQRRGIPHISTGDIFRANISNETELGLKVKGILASGGYVTDEITNEIVKNRLAEADAANGFLLDGYPRTANQVGALDAMLAENGHAVDAVLELTVDSEELVQRLVKRAETSGRSDDTEDVIRERQELYVRETAPLAKAYAERGQLVAIDGMGEIDEVEERINAALDEVAAKN